MAVIANQGRFSSGIAIASLTPYRYFCETNHLRNSNQLYVIPART
jgi:hypothetical protein